MIPRPPTSTLFPYTTLFRSGLRTKVKSAKLLATGKAVEVKQDDFRTQLLGLPAKAPDDPLRSEEHTSELQSLTNLVCRLLLEKKKKTNGDEYKSREQETCKD